MCSSGADQYYLELLQQEEDDLFIEHTLFFNKNLGVDSPHKAIPTLI